MIRSGHRALSSRGRGSPAIQKFGSEGAVAALIAMAPGAIDAATAPLLPHFQICRESHEPGDTAPAEGAFPN